MEFVTWGKIPRFNKPWEITEKVDGTNAQIFVERVAWGSSAGMDSSKSAICVVQDESEIGEDGLPVYEWHVKAGSRNRWLTPQADNFGFAKFVWENAKDLVKLGKGRHYGEWYGLGIQRGYGLLGKKFALFNTAKLCDIEECCETIPGVETVMVLNGAADGPSVNASINECLDFLRDKGSQQVPGFMKPEGVVVRHTQSGARFKVLLEGDNEHKWSSHVEGNV